MRLTISQSLIFQESKANAFPRRQNRARWFFTFFYGKARPKFSKSRSGSQGPSLCHRLWGYLYAPSHYRLRWIAERQTFLVFMPKTQGGSARCRRTARLTDQSSSAKLLKIRADLGVFLVADSVYLFQIIGTAERPCGNNPSSNHWSDVRNHFQFLFRRGVDVDLAQLDFFFCMRLFNLSCADSGGQRAQCWRCRNPGEPICQRQCPGSRLLFGYENTERCWLLRVHI